MATFKPSSDRKPDDSAHQPSAVALAPPPPQMGLLHPHSSIHQLAAVFAYSSRLRRRTLTLGVRAQLSEWISPVGRGAGLSSASVTQRKYAVIVSWRSPPRCAGGTSCLSGLDLRQGKWERANICQAVCVCGEGAVAEGHQSIRVDFLFLLFGSALPPKAGTPVKGFKRDLINNFWS